MSNLIASIGGAIHPLKRKAVARLLVLLAVTLSFLVLVAIVGFLFVRAQDSATPVQLADAIARFDDMNTAGIDGMTQNSGPDPGVYVYDTAGEESISALGGATHSYPAITTMTIRASPCGFDTRWDALEERIDEQNICVTDSGAELRSVSSYHEFFGRGDRRDFQCDAGSMAPPWNVRAGDQWTTKCSNDDALFTGSAQVVGVERLLVGDAEIEALHYRVQVVNEGASRGTALSEMWVVPRTGLVIKKIVQLNNEVDSLLGMVHYSEEYTIELRSLGPMPAEAIDDGRAR